MPDSTTLLLFAGSALALLAIPGPSVVYVFARTLEHGRPAGLASMLGLETGALAHVGLSAVGVTAVVAASAWSLTALRYAGAAYLVVLGLRELRRRRPMPGAAAAGTTPIPHRRLFLDGVLVDLLNPKTGLFFLAFLPQFVDPARGPVTSQVLVLGVCFVLLAGVVDTCYALAADRLRSRLERRTTDGRSGFWRRCSGVVYFALGGVTVLA